MRSNIDNEEMRKRRVERLAAFERAQQSNPQNTPDTSEERSQDSSPYHSSSRINVEKKNPPATTNNKDTNHPPVGLEPKLPFTKARTPITRAPTSSSVAHVFQVSESDVPQDWKEAMEFGIDSILWDRITSPGVKPLDYLIDCYNRAGKLPSNINDISLKVQDACITMGYISASADHDDEVHDNLGAALLSSASGNKLDRSFVNKILMLAKEDRDIFVFMLHDVVKTILNSLEFGKPNTASAINLLGQVLEIPGAAELILVVPKNQLSPAVISNTTLLGKLLGIGAGADGFARLHSAEVISNSNLEELAELAKQTEPINQLLEESQFKFVEKFIRHNATTRRLVLNWFISVLNANHSQMAMNRIPGKTNSLQLMLNAFKVLLRLADPFVKLDSGSLMQQLKKINANYFANKFSYDIEDETKVLASQDAPFNTQQSQENLNFVTECFYLCAGFLHYGFHATIQALDGSFKRQIAQADMQLERLNTMPDFRIMNPVQQQLTLARFHSAIKVVKAEYAGLYVVIHNAEFMGQVLRFSELTLSYDIYVAERAPNSIKIRVPWDEEPPECYSSFPEFIVEAPLAASAYVLKSVEFIRNPSMSVDNQLLVDACIFFMSSPKTLRNPYLRSKFVEILYYGGADIPLTSGSSVPGTLSTLFTTSDTCRQFLLPALMSVFIDIEHTGRTSQFYEKFTTRELVANVLKVIWRDPHYRNQLVTESQEKPEFFVKFVALLLNDATFLLDEALGKLLEVHKLQNQPKESEATTTESSQPADPRSNNDDTNNGNQEDDEDEMSTDNDPASRLRNAERSAQNFLQLSNSTMTLLNTFTSTVPYIFATPEIIDRFAVMLNYNLAALVGPRCRELKVQNQAQLGFNPRQLLTDLVKVYLNLRAQSPFPKSLSKDERSYNDNNFKKAFSILSRYSLLSPIELENFEDLAKRTLEAWKETQVEEEEYGDDIPDEFLDPLMFELMENPVILPTSKVNIDLSTIKTHLLSDPTDPFNRVPLKIEDVIENTELKERIEQFKKQKKEIGRKLRESGAATEDQMDVS